MFCQPNDIKGFLLVFAVTQGLFSVSAMAESFCEEHRIEITEFGPAATGWFAFLHTSPRLQASSLKVAGELIGNIRIRYSDEPYPDFEVDRRNAVVINGMTFETRPGTKDTYLFWSNSHPSIGFSITERIDGTAASRVHLRSTSYPSANVFISYNQGRGKQELLQDIYCFLTSESLKRGLK